MREGKKNEREGMEKKERERESNEREGREKKEGEE